MSCIFRVDDELSYIGQRGVLGDRDIFAFLPDYLPVKNHRFLKTDIISYIQQYLIIIPLIPLGRVG